MTSSCLSWSKNQFKASILTHFQKDALFLKILPVSAYINKNDLENMSENRTFCIRELLNAIFNVLDF